MFVLLSISGPLVTQPGVMSFVSGSARPCVGGKIFVFDYEPLQFGFAAERTHPPDPGKPSILAGNIFSCFEKNSTDHGGLEMQCVVVARRLILE